MSSIHNKLPVAREGAPFIIIPLALALGVVPVGWPWAVPFLAFGLFSAWFFRDPERTPPPGEAAVLSPADGTIIKVEKTLEEEFLNDEVLKISIFMSVFNVHVNRAPLTGKIIETQYHPGKFFVASLDKASTDNERHAMLLETKSGRRLVFTQIAGLIARRIVPWIKAEDEVTRGQRVGLIRFGSRLDVYLPLDAEISVKPGLKVKAGQSILGYIWE